MSRALFEPDPGEPLDLFVHEMDAPERLRGARALGFEFTSRGDRVPGRLLLPAAEAPAPVVLLQHGAGGSKEAEYLEVACAPWVRGGMAVASIDFPLHGERATSKLSERLRSAGRTSASDRDLRIEFAHQAVLDLRRAVDALETRPELEATRLGYAAFSMGTILGANFVAVDPRPRAAAFAIGGGGFGPSEVDPVTHVGAIAPRPVLFVNTTQDETIPRSAAAALHEAAREPKEVAWFEGTHTGVPGAALKKMWTFLAEHLEVPLSR